MATRQRDIALRIGAGLACCVVLPFALAGAGIMLLVVGFAAQAPDAFGYQGDPCCSPPETWGDVLSASAFAVPLVVLVTLAWTTAASLVCTVVSERGVPLRTFARNPLRALSCLVVALPFCWMADEPRLRADCDTFTVSAADWRGEEGDRWRSAEAIDRCNALDGTSQAAVRKLLGRPDERRRNTWVYYRALGYNDSGVYNLTVVLRAGRVVRARLR